jgi:DNA-binding FadR family transcriptional regulator
MTLTPIEERRSVAQMVVDQILTEISTGKLKTGDSLPVIPELAKTLKVGSTTVREALKILEARGLIEIVFRKGIFIKSRANESHEHNGTELQMKFGRKHLPDLVDYWFVQIIGGTGLVCRNRTPKDIKALKQIMWNLEKSARAIIAKKAGSRTYETYGKQYLLLFQTLGESTHNVVFMEAMNGILRILSEYMPLPQVSFTQEGDKIQAILNCTKVLVDAIEQRDLQKSIENAQKITELSRLIIQNAIFDSDKTTRG